MYLTHNQKLDIAARRYTSLLNFYEHYDEIGWDEGSDAAAIEYQDNYDNMLEETGISQDEVDAYLRRMEIEAADYQAYMLSSS